MFAKFYDVDNCVHLKLNDRTEEEALKIAKEVDSEVYSTKHELQWHSIGGKYYRFKFFDRFYSILNELIGPKIAHKLDLKTVNNFPAILDYNEELKLYGIISENFKDPNKEYLTMTELGFKPRTNPDYKNLKQLKRYCRKEDYEELLNGILKMTCLDYILGQADRVLSNFLFEKDGKKITFAPLFDYAEAYECIKEGCVYDKYKNSQLKFSVGNSIIAPAFWEPKFQRILKKYPQFREYLDKVCNIDIMEILEEIEDEHRLKIPDDYKEYYDVRTKEKQKIYY